MLSTYLYILAVPPRNIKNVNQVDFMSFLIIKFFKICTQVSKIMFSFYKYCLKGVKLTC